MNIYSVFENNNKKKNIVSRQHSLSFLFFSLLSLRGVCRMVCMSYGVPLDTGNVVEGRRGGTAFSNHLRQEGEKENEKEEKEE